jgi:hypothetical protein
MGSGGVELFTTHQTLELEKVAGGCCSHRGDDPISQSRSAFGMALDRELVDCDWTAEPERDSSELEQEKEEEKEKGLG